MVNQLIVVNKFIVVAVSTSVTARSMFVMSGRRTDGEGLPSQPLDADRILVGGRARRLVHHV